MNHVWKIYDLKRVIADGIVTKITYACESSEDNSSTRKIGDIELTGSVDDAGFIAFEDLTEEIVLGWATSSIDTSIFETENSASIAQQVIQRAAITTKSGTPW
jgi:hypothetical protein